MSFRRGMNDEPRRAIIEIRSVPSVICINGGTSEADVSPRLIARAIR
jgi:hypothetical protein